MSIFDDDLAYSISDEIKKKNYQIITRNFNVKRFDAIEQNGKKDINDLNCELTDGSKIKFEFKNRRKGAIWNDICLEIHTDIHTNRLGWVFNLIKNNIDYVIYTWHGKQRECYIIIKAKELESWWRLNWQKYPMKKNIPSVSTTGTWQSSYSFVPIKDFPKEIIYKHETFVDLDDFWGQK